MNDSLSPTLVAEVRGLILKTFDVSEQEAHEHASGLVALAEGWGNPKTAPNLDWLYRVKKSLGVKLRWRSDEDHEGFQLEQERCHKAYDTYIQRGKRP